eukprot:g6126.t1
MPNLKADRLCEEFGEWWKQGEVNLRAFLPERHRKNWDQTHATKWWNLRKAYNGIPEASPMPARSAIEARMDLQFFIQKNATQRTSVGYSVEQEQHHKYKWSRVVDLQMDGSVKGKSKKVAHQVYMLCSDLKTQKLAQLLQPLALQTVKMKMGPSGPTHSAAADRLEEILKVLADLLDGEFLVGMEASGPGEEEKPVVLVIDTDQEASEQRAARSLAHCLRLVNRIGIHHRLSNSSSTSKMFKELKTVLRMFSGGRVSQKSLRGAFRAALESLRRRIEREGFEPAQTNQIQRETGLPIREAFRSVRDPISLVRCRWFGDFMVASWSATNAGRCLAVLDEMERIALEESPNGQIELVLHPDEDLPYADQFLDDDGKPMDIDDLLPGPAPEVDDGDNVFLQELAEMEKQDRNGLGAPDDVELASEDQKFEKMSAENKVKLLRRRLLAVTEDARSHFLRLHKKPHHFHLLHLQLTHGKQADPDAFTEEAQNYMEEHFPDLVALRGKDITAVMKATSDILPHLLAEFILEAVSLCRTHLQTLESLQLIRCTARHFLWEKFDPSFNLWNSYFRRGSIPKSSKSQLLKIHEKTGRLQTQLQKDFQHYLASDYSGIKTAHEVISRVIVSGCASDSTGESVWRYLSDAEKKLRASEKQHTLSAKLHAHQERNTHYPKVPAFFPPFFQHRGAPLDKFAELLAEPEKSGLDDIKEEYREISFSTKKQLKDYFGELEQVQSSKKPLPPSVVRNILMPAKRICMNADGPVAAAPQTYMLPAWEVAAALESGHGRTAQELRTVEVMGVSVDGMTRHKDWLQKKGLLVYFDVKKGKFLFAIDVGRAKSTALPLLVSADGRRGSVSRKGPLIFGYAPDCMALQTYDDVDYSSGVPEFNLAGVWITFEESLIATVDSLPGPVLRDVLEYYLELPVEDHPVETAHRQLLKDVLQTQDLDVAQLKYTEWLHTAKASHGRLDENPEYVRRHRICTGLEGGGGGSGRTFLGYVRNTKYWKASCAHCQTHAASVHKFERRTGDRPGRHLGVQYKVVVPEGVARHPSTMWPEAAVGVTRIKEALSEDMLRVHGPACLFPQLEVEEISQDLDDKLDVFGDTRVGPPLANSANASGSSSSAAANAPKAARPKAGKAKSKAGAKSKAAPKRQSNKRAAAPADDGRFDLAAARKVLKKMKKKKLDLSAGGASSRRR